MMLVTLSAMPLVLFLRKPNPVTRRIEQTAPAAHMD